MKISQIPSQLAFIPSRVEGHEDVSLVRVFPDRLVIESSSGDRVIRFAKIARYYESLLWRLAQRLMFRRPGSPIVAARDWFHEPSERFFCFYTTPRLTISMPVDEPEDYLTSNFFWIQQVIRSGGFETFDLG